MALDHTGSNYFVTALTRYCSGEEVPEDVWNELARKLQDVADDVFATAFRDEDIDV